MKRSGNNQYYYFYSNILQITRASGWDRSKLEESKGVDESRHSINL